MCFTPAQARQLATVLRLRRGERVVVLDGCGSAFDVSLTVVTPKDARGAVTAPAVAGGEPGVRLTLVQGLLRAANWETVLQKGTEVGVSRFAPIRCRRSVVSRSDHLERGARWRQIVQEAAEQSGRCLVPEVQNAVSFSEGCGVGGPVRILLHPGFGVHPPLSGVSGVGTGHRSGVVRWAGGRVRRGRSRGSPRPGVGGGPSGAAHPPD